VYVQCRYQRQKFEIYRQEKESIMLFRKLVTPLIVLLAISVLGLATPRTNPNSQDKKDPVTGSYEGIAKSEALGDIPIKVDLKHDSGKLSGSIDTPQGAAPITSGTYANGQVNLKFDAGGNEGTVTAQLKDDRIVGTWTLAGQNGTLDLKRAGMTAAAPTKSTPSSSSSAADPSGEWDATADAQGMTVPFTLKVKVDGDRVTGESTSPQGTAPISKGSWVAQKLSFALDTPNGLISFTAVIKDGKLVGDFDFAGQMQGKWEAKKK
jgi:hypothetical protein